MPINFVIKLAATAAMEAAQVGLQALNKTQGPRLSETQVTTADYGTPIPRFKGARKFAGQIIWSKPLEIVNHTSKVKGGGKQTTQSALWTAAVVFADCPQSTGPIDKVLKIWLDETLAYDATGTGPISYASSLGFDLASVMRIYTGSETQMPDPVYSAWCEDKYGPDSAPAFRELAYLIFDKMPCDNFGNRPPQITVLATSSASSDYPFEVLTSDGTDTSNQMYFSPGGDWMVHINGSTLNWWDVPSRARIGSSAVSGFPPMGNVSLAADGTAYYVTFDGSGHVNLVETAPLGIALVTRTDAPTNFTTSTRVLEPSSTTRRIITAYTTNSGYIDGIAHVSHTQSLRDCCVTGDGKIVGLFQPTGSSNQFTIEDLDGGISFTITGSAAPRSGPIKRAHLCHVSAQAHFFVVSDGYWYTIDDTTGAIKASGSGTLYDGGDPGAIETALSRNFAEQKPQLTSIWQYTSPNLVQYSLTDASVLESHPISSWATTASSQHRAYDSINNALWTNPNPMKLLYLNRAANAGVTLGDCVTAMCTDAGMNDFDASALTQTVLGYSWTRGDVKSQMQPLLDIHDVDARPHDFTIQFLPRGSSSSGTILTGDFAKNGSSPRYTVTIAQDTDLPQTLRVNFADTGFDQQPNNIISVLPTDAVDSQRDDTIDLSNYGDTPSGAQQKGDRYLRRQWLSRESLTNSLTAQKMAIEPGDVQTLSLDGVVQNYRLTKQTFSSGRIDCTWTRDETSAAAVNANTTGPAMTRDTETIQIPAPVRGFVIDAPFRDDSDADTRPLLYAGAGAWAQLSFPGASVWEETGTGDTAAYDTLLDRISTGATWGLCNGTLANVPVPWLWDRGSTLNVSLQNGSLTSCTEADVDADPSLNLILVGSNSGGWEYVNFTTATLQGDGTYNLSDFKRGRRGTEWACGTHSSGEAWVLASSLKVEAMGLDEVADTLSFKTQATGRSLDSASVADVTPFSGDTLKPYAPARIEWTTDGTDMFGTIIRRTRIGASWVGGSTIPLSENGEAYEVDIYHGSTFKRTISVSGGNTFTYTGTEISADGNTVGVAPPCNAYQLSDAVGRGFALAA